MDENNFYDELINEKDFNKSRNVKTIFVILLIVFILFLGGYLTYLKINEKPELEVKDKIEENIQSFDLICSDNCEYKININEEIIPIVYSITNDMDNDIHQLKINNNLVINKSLNCGGLANLKVLDDVIIISYHDGCDIGGNTLNGYTKDGREIFSYEYMDSFSNMWIETTNFEVVNKKIIVNATRMYHDLTLRLTKESEVNICNKDEWPIYMIGLDTITSGIYEIEYLGNFNFGSPILKQEESIKDIINTCGIYE